jgi:hypothetical protein
MYGMVGNLPLMLGASSCQLGLWNRSSHAFDGKQGVRSLQAVCPTEPEVELYSGGLGVLE